ncbi:putative xanthine permease [Gordonia otitidis NBRC 100426]|uniref:Xanthine permease n=1 Tax=Gordonia otitidis (strain DSM 44809 / CCUG 52243 / JCM 12355 / NBRC 100426 / IFM 10032) TaxID=1108044 RepID=H5TT20_GORO1|nr:putative xanthine permease [Gordonia otitidis NBRC 100426]
MTTEATPASTPAKKRKRVHPVDQVPPPGKLVALGAQHVVAFYAGAVLVPLLIARAIGLDSDALTMLITADLFTCGIASLLQSVGIWKIGVRLPLLQASPSPRSHLSSRSPTRTAADASACRRSTAR